MTTETQRSNLIDQMINRPIESKVKLTQQSNVEHARGDYSCPAARQIPAQNLKGKHRKNRIRLETFRGDKNWENENSRLLEHKASPSMSIMLS